MSRRTAKPKLTPLWMPYLRDKLADWLDEHHNYVYGRISSDFEDALHAAWSRGDSLRTSSMWYVSRDMTALAMHTALHESPPEVDAPSASGFIIFDGGLNLTGIDDAPLAHVVALRWIVRYGTAPTQRVGISLFCDDDEIRESLHCNLPLVPLPRTSMQEEARDLHDFFGRLLLAVWALSAEPTVCTVTSPQHTSALEPLPPKIVDYAIKKVRMIVLRENLHSPRKDDTETQRRAPLSHRFIVRGFWRNQAYGKNHELRRKQWIPPFVKGPADAPLIAKETVRIWRR